MAKGADGGNPASEDVIEITPTEQSKNKGHSQPYKGYGFKKVNISSTSLKDAIR